MTIKTLTKATVAGLAGAVALSAAAPAEAHGWHRGGDGAAVAVGAGILGLAVGAAIASDHPRYYYDDYYYGPAYYPAYPAYTSYYYSYPRPYYRGYRYYAPYRGYRGYNGYRGYYGGYRHHW